jgi:hypothetical protein
MEMKANRIGTLIVYALIAGCGGPGLSPAEQQLAVGAVAQGTQVGSLATRPERIAKMLASRVALLRPSSQLHAQSDVIDVGQTTCVLSDPQAIGGAERSSGTCNGGALAIDVTSTASGDHFVVDLTMSGQLDGAQVQAHEHADLDLSPSLLSGTMHEDSQVILGAATGTRTDDFTFEGVGLDGSGCAVSGSVHATRVEDLNGAPDSVDVVVAFGPACGEVSRL